MKASDRSGPWLALAGTICVLAGAAITTLVNHLDHNADLEEKRIELGIGILRTEPTPETVPLRQWAIDVIGHAGFDFTAQQQSVLLQQQLPYRPGSFTPGYTDYAISAWPQGINDLPCSAFQKNPDGSWTVTAMLHLGGPNGLTMQGNTFKGTNEARMIEARCGTPNKP